MIPKKQAQEFLKAADALHKGLAAAASVMQECPSCNRGAGLRVAAQVWKALDMYEPAATEFLKAIREAEAK